MFRRTFEALQYPKGSKERARLNSDPRTSEWQRSYRYCVFTDFGHSICRTRSEAVQLDHRQADRNQAGDEP